MSLDAQEVDKKAAHQKFIAKIAEHTLDDLAGKASLQVASTLRSTFAADAWHLELLRLRGNHPPKSEFQTKIGARIFEAQKWVNLARAEKHRKFVEHNRLNKKPSSLGNRSQVAAIIYGALIKAGVDRESSLSRACEDAEEIVRRMDNEACAS